MRAFCLFVAICVLCVAIDVPAEIHVDTLWADTSDSYNINGTVKLLPGVTLTIVDGVTVTLANGAVLDLSEGIVSVSGSADVGVEFEADAFDGSWQDGQGTIYLPSAATIVQATFAGFIAIDGKGANEVEFSGFSEILTIDLALNDCAFLSNDYGLKDVNGVSAEDTYFEGNDVGLEGSAIRLLNCEVSDNKVAISSSSKEGSAGLSITNSTIQNNELAFKLNDGKDALVQFNNIVSNNHIASGHYDGKFSLNFYGTTDFNTIASGFDLDSSSVPLAKLIQPILSSPIGPIQ